MFKWRLENRNSYYKTMIDWWEGHQAFNGTFKGFKKSSLPHRIFVVSNDEKDLFAVPVYVSDADFVYMAFITSNPYADVKEKIGALEFLYERIGEYMAEIGFERILITCNISGLMKSLERGGFDKVEQTNYFVKVL